MASSDADKIERERQFHDHRFEINVRAKAQRYYSVEAGRGRYHEMLDAIPSGARVLEYGCGPGSAAFDLAAHGADVVGIDISPVAIDKATATAKERGVPATFSTMNAEALEFPDDHFDYVVGTGILHHLDLELASEQLRRVLKPTGTGIFLEPMGTNPIINLYRNRTPAMRTPDEHPFVFSDFTLFGRYFGQVTSEFFDVAGMAGIVLKKVPGGKRVTKGLHALDRRLFKWIPPYRRLAWMTLVTLQNPR